MTTAQCNLLCHNEGFHYYAVQDSNECWCSPSSWKPRYKKVADAVCNRPCAGDTSVMCGGRMHNSVYAVAPAHPFKMPPGCIRQAAYWAHAAKAATELLHSKPEGPGKYLGCFQDHPGAKNRDLPVNTNMESLEIKLAEHDPNGKHKMTIQWCSQLCQNLGHTYYALQNHYECRCAAEDWLPKYGKRPLKACNTPCAGNPKAMCGGRNHNSVFRLVPKAGPDHCPSCNCQTDAHHAATTHHQDKQHDVLHSSSSYAPVHKKLQVTEHGPNDHAHDAEDLDLSDLVAKPAHLPVQDGGSNSGAWMWAAFAIGAVVVGVGALSFMNSKAAVAPEEKMPPMDCENEKLANEYFDNQS